MSEDTTSDRVRVAEIKKNGRELVAFDVGPWKGRKLATVRVWYPGEDGTMLPSREGIAFSSQKLQQVRAGIDAMIAECERRGWPIDETSSEAAA